ncbi:hypothetical protein ZWY2020_001488 [Hordeum vulgare]|nr:hypothetical protein ZWY2020_001488 [Hordeum vulgare]
MGSDFKAIPLIDIGPPVEKIDDPAMAGDEGVLGVVRMLDAACRRPGHGISESLMTEVRDVTRKFFQLPHQEKLKIKMTPQSGYRGYQRVGENVTKGKPDMHEAIDCYTPIEPGRYGDLAKPMEGSNLWPDYPSNFDALLENYKPSTSGAHTDYGNLLTLVNHDDDICALEVHVPSLALVSQTSLVSGYMPVPRTFVCNIGDMLKVWSNGIYQPTLHRVVNNSPRHRVSVAFFYEGAGVVLRGENGGVAKYEKVVYGEHLVQKVLTNFCHVRVWEQFL